MPHSLRPLRTGLAVPEAVPGLQGGPRALLPGQDRQHDDDNCRAPLFRCDDRDVVHQKEGWFNNSELGTRGILEFFQ